MSQLNGGRDSTVKLEIFASTRQQPGTSTNEDAFLIGSEPVVHAAICDGAGRADGVARKTTRMFKQLFSCSNAQNSEREETWLGWISSLDSAMIGRGETTFIGFAVIGGNLCGAYVGDSRGYLVRADGTCELKTGSTSKARLGSGRARGHPLSLTLEPGDRFLIVSDGIWTPFESPLKMGQLVLTKSMLRHDLIPEAIVEEVFQTGHQDDMTVVILFAT